MGIIPDSITGLYLRRRAEHAWIETTSKFTETLSEWKSKFTEVHSESRETESQQVYQEGRSV